MAIDIMAGLGVFKSLYDSAKALKDINDATVRNGAIVELQEKILAAQATQSALIDRIRELEKEVADFETWDTEKLNYEMKALASGAIVYALKPEIQGSAPPHYLCAACYQHRKKSILQFAPTSIVHAQLGKPRMYRCPECKAEVMA